MAQKIADVIWEQRGYGIGYDCTETDCFSNSLYMCWKCALAKEVVHPGAEHVLRSRGEDEDIPSTAGIPDDGSEVFEEEDGADQAIESVDDETNAGDDDEDDWEGEGTTLNGVMIVKRVVIIDIGKIEGGESYVEDNNAGQSPGVSLEVAEATSISVFIS
jgi:hypothetical protein